MRVWSVALLEWPDGIERGGPRLLGRTSDTDLVARVREQLAAERRQELSRLERGADDGTKPGSECVQ